MLWLADDDPTKLDALERMPIIDYWHLLNRKIGAAKEALSKSKTQRRARNRS